jgi:hypothetical protein
MSTEPIPATPQEFTPLQILVIVILLATLLSAAAQWDNQFKLHKATPNSYQRRLCLAAASIAFLMIIGYISLLAIYIGDIRAGWPSGRVLPGQRSIPFTICAIYCTVASYSGSCIIVLASLHRYHRLCSVVKGSKHEKFFNAAKYGSITATIIVIMANISHGFIYRSPIFVVIIPLCLFWLIFTEFYANVSVFLNTNL